jgi:hypothetical protein
MPKIIEAKLKEGDRIPVGDALNDRDRHYFCPHPDCEKPIRPHKASYKNGELIAQAHFEHKKANPKCRLMK